jgi:hypothetical protein
METCKNCDNTYYRNGDGVQLCRRNALETELIAKAENHAEKGCRHFVPIDPESIVPAIVQARWSEELKLNRITGWRTLAQLCASIALKAEAARPCSPLADVMKAKAEEAKRYMLALQPEREECHGNA